MSGNLTVSNNLSVAGSITSASLTTNQATIPNLTVSNLTVSGTTNTGTFSDLTTNTLNTNSISATSSIVSPQILVGTKNVGTSISTLENNMTLAQTNIASLQTKTTNQSYASSTQTTSILGTLSTPAITLNGNDLNTRLTTDETNISNLQTKTTNQSFTGTTTSFTGTLSTPAITLNTVDLNTRLTTDETNITNLQTKTTNQSFTGSTTSFTGTLSAPILNASGLITANGGFTLPTSKVMSLVGNISANSTTITPTILSYISSLSSNAQTQLTNLQTKTNNMSATATDTSFTQTTNTSILKASGLITANGGLDIPSSKTLSLSGNISANSTTITPIVLSYISSLSSNVQTQINSLNSTSGKLSLQNTWTNWNNFFSGSFCDHTNTNLSRTANIPTQQGIHLQWNRDGTDGYSYIMNNKGQSSTNSGFRFQRFNSSGVYIDEPLTIADTINMTSPLNITSTITANTGNFTNANIDNINGKFFITKDINTGSSNQSVIYQAGSTVIYAGQTNNTQHMFACLDSSGNQTTPLTMNSSGVSIPTIQGNMSSSGNITCATLTCNNPTKPMPGNVAGYIFGAGSGLFPIICSVSDTSYLYGSNTSTTGYIGITNYDKGFIIFPRYKIIPYRHPAYGTPYTNASLLYDNTEGTSPTYIQENIKDLGAIKVYYNNVEVKILSIS